jgi:hypothetical protein
MRPQQQDVHRRLDGSIDIDFYRQRGLMERRIVMTGFFKGFGQLVKPLAAALYAAPSRDDTGWNAPTASGHGIEQGGPHPSMTAAQLNAAR